MIAMEQVETVAGVGDIPALGLIDQPAKSRD
jgi:hypothetical protein